MEARRRRAAAVLAAVGLHVRGPRPAAAPPAGARESSIAVLPFADLSAEHDQEHFAIGISDEIRNTLARVAGLRVIGRTSSVALRGKGEDARTIAEKLGISALLDGSIRKAGSRVRVAVELIEASRGTQLWSAMYDRDLADVLAVQVEIARQVVAALDVRIQTGGLAAVPERPSTSPAAYEAYLLGNLRSQESSPELPAEEMYQRAVSLDPGYAPAWAQLAASLVQWSQYVSESPDVRRRRFERAAAAADQAIALAPRLPDGYEARALVRYAFLWDWAGALADAERAVALGPGRPVAHRRYSMVLDRFGESEKALEQLRTALELDPLDGITLNNLTVGYMSAGRLDLARRALDRAFEIAPRGAPVMWMTAAELALAEGRPAEALALFERNPVESNRLIGRVLAHHALGDDRASRAALAELTARYGANDPFLVAVAHAERGECDLVVDWVDRGVAQHGRGINYVHAGLRKCAAKDPRYVPLLRKLNLPVPAPR